MPSRRLENLIKIVLDTNNLISAQINKKGPSFKIFNLFQEKKVIFYSSPFQLRELERALKYKRIRKKYKLSFRTVKKVVGTIEKYAYKAYPLKILPIIKDDPDDNHILAIAHEGQVDFIISGDKHLLELKKFKNIPIITARDFLKIKRVRKKKLV